MMMDLSRLVLDTLHREGEIADSTTLMTPDGCFLEPQELLGTLKSLSSHDMVAFDAVETEKLVPTAEGQQILSHGSHECKVYELADPHHGTPQIDVEKTLGEAVAKIGLGKALQRGWVELREGRLHRKVAGGVVDDTQVALAKLQAGDTDVPDGVIRELLKRRLVERRKFVKFAVRKGPGFALEMRQLLTDLTNDVLVSGRWQEQPWKAYNFRALGQPTSGGHLHPLLKVRQEFRQIFFEMGFSEMPTNQYVESSFWNFDTLFQPQQHPSRDAHDTFFLAEPRETRVLPGDYVERTCQVHSIGGYGSEGHKYAWKVEEARKNILRTHTTAVSARMLYKLAQEPKFRPAKYFSIDKVFRNETVDATHLAEFHQIEGLVADHGLTLGDLIGMLDQFFRKLGLRNLRFKPAFNPYTEPSMEVFAWHAGLGRWIEVGNSGVFRPEMLEPMGFEPGVRVMGWGLSLERPTMIKYGISNIRDLVGHKVDLSMVQRNPVCRLDK